MEFSVSNPEEEPMLLNPNSHDMAWIFLLDTPCNMAGEPINNITNAINNLVRETSENDSIREILAVAFLEFNNAARVVQDFMPICKMKPITLSADGSGLVMRTRINLALDKVKESRCLYAFARTTHYKSWIVIVTSGKCTNDISVTMQSIYDVGQPELLEKLKI